MWRSLVLVTLVLPVCALTAQHSSKSINPEYFYAQIDVLNNDSLRYRLMENDLNATVVNSSFDTSSLSSVLEDSKGTIKLIAFWSTFCPPCRKAMPKIVDLQCRYGQDDFQVIFINIYDKVPYWKIWSDASPILSNQTSLKVTDYFQCKMVDTLLLRVVGRYVILDEQNRICNSFDMFFDESFVNRLELMLHDAGISGQ